MALCAVLGTPLAVIDVDTKNGADSATVQAWLGLLKIPILAEVATPSGGLHFYVPGHQNLPTVHADASRDGLEGLPGVEVLSHGTNVFLPGTKRPKYNGAGYTILTSGLFEAIDPAAALPLVTWIDQNRAQPKTDAQERGDVRNNLRTFHSPDARERAYLKAVLDNQGAEIARTPSGGRNHALYTAALKCGSFITGAGLSEAEAWRTLEQAANTCGLTKDDGAASVQATIRSGLANGKRSPLGVPDQPNTGSADDLRLTRTKTTSGSGPSQKPGKDQADDGGRQGRLIAASSITPKTAHWAWTDQGKGRLPAGALTLAAGREGTGKSSFGIWMAAHITRGTLPGVHQGTPSNVIYLAVEDSWAHTLIPRLMAAGADLDRVFRFDVIDDGLEAGVTLPSDMGLLEKEILAQQVKLVVGDPLLSLINGKIDSHNERDLRRALDPLSRMADRTGATILGIAHFNKSAGSDIASLITGSAAWRNVPRAILGFARDEDTGIRVMSQAKNSLGTNELPSLEYVIDSRLIPVSDGTADVGRFEFVGESTRTVGQMLAARNDYGDGETLGELGAAKNWLQDVLSVEPGGLPSKDLKKRARVELGASDRTLKRAAQELGLVMDSFGFPRVTTWSLPVGPVGPATPEKPPAGPTTGPTGPTASTRGNTPSSASRANSWGPPGQGGPTLGPTGATGARSCAGCGEPMPWAEPGQTTHPNCDPPPEPHQDSLPERDKTIINGKVPTQR
ncbi:MAG: AAA family ATPase [Acidobacteriota bacterium]|nr:AAA family ATPase [Acidobacteriota bacterium]